MILNKFIKWQYFSLKITLHPTSWLYTIKTDQKENRKNAKIPWMFIGHAWIALKMET